MLAEKAKDANLGTEHKKLLTSNACAAVDKDIHLLAIELNLKKGSFELTMENSVAKRKLQADIPYEVQTVQTKLLQEFGILPTSKQSGKSKEGANKECTKPTGNRAGFTGEDRSTMEDGMPKRTTAEQLQKMQDKSDVISNLQLELRKDIHAFKLSRLQDDDTSSDMTNTWEAHLVTVPNQVVREHNRGKKRQVKDAMLWKQVPPGPGVPYTMTTMQGKSMHWCPHHHKWTLHPPNKCRIQPVLGGDQGLALNGVQRENF